MHSESVDDMTLGQHIINGKWTVLIQRLSSLQGFIHSFTHAYVQETGKTGNLIGTGHFTPSGGARNRTATVPIRK